MRPDRVSRDSATHPGDPVRIRAADTAELHTPANGGTRPDLQWAGVFQTPEGQFSILHAILHPLLSQIIIFLIMTYLTLI